MKRVLSAVVTVLYAACLSPAFAAHPLSTDDTGTTGSKRFQVETSAEFGWDRDTAQGVTTTSRYQNLNVAVTGGVLDSLDLALSFPYSWQKIEDDSGGSLANSGLNDFSLALKWRFLELGPTSFAIKPTLTVPTGSRDKNLGTGRAGYGATLISTYESAPLALHANAGYTRQNYPDADKDTSRSDLWYFSLAGTVEITKGLRVVTETGTASNPNLAGADWAAFVAGGMIYTVRENIDLSLGFRGGISAPATDSALLTAITCTFP